ncbi:MAG: hypothetical protein R6V56_05135 [Lentisphaeria bacterium]
MTDNSAIDTVSIAKRRAPILIFIFLIWALAICLRLFQVMVINRDTYLEQMAASSWCQDTIPAIRGRILDKTGHPLAWSTRHFKLLWDTPPDTERCYRELKLIRETLPISTSALPATLQGKNLITLVRDLHPTDFKTASELASALKSVKISSFFIRHRVSDPRLQKRLGDVVLRNGTEVGVSGAELEHDSLLRGRPGVFKVMLSPRGNWLPQTWQQIRPVKAGYDVYLPLRFVPAPASEAVSP